MSRRTRGPSTPPTEELPASPFRIIAALKDRPAEPTAIIPSVSRLSHWQSFSQSEIPRANAPARRVPHSAVSSALLLVAFLASSLTYHVTVRDCNINLYVCLWGFFIAALYAARIGSQTS